MKLRFLHRRLLAETANGERILTEFASFETKKKEGREGGREGGTWWDPARKIGLPSTDFYCIIKAKIQVTFSELLG